MARRGPRLIPILVAYPEVDAALAAGCSDCRECRRKLASVYVPGDEVASIRAGLRGRAVTFLACGTYNAVFTVGNSRIMRLAVPTSSRPEGYVREERRVLGRLESDRFKMLAPESHATFQSVYVSASGKQSVFINYVSQRYVPFTDYLESSTFLTLADQGVKKLAKQIAMLVTCLVFQAGVVCSDVKADNMVADTAVRPAVPYLIDFDEFCYVVPSGQERKRKRDEPVTWNPGATERRAIVDMCCLQTAMSIVVRDEAALRRSPALQRLVLDLLPGIPRTAYPTYERVARMRPPAGTISKFTFLEMLTHNIFRGAEVKRGDSFARLYEKCIRMLAKANTRPPPGSYVGAAVRQAADAAGQTSCDKLLELRRTILRA